MSSRHAATVRSRRAVSVSTHYAVAVIVALSSGGCQIQRFEADHTSVTEAWQTLAITREPETPPPLSRAHVMLSEFALEHFVELELAVSVTSGQSLEQQGLLAYWLGDLESAPVRTSFEGVLSNTLHSQLLLDTAPCAAVPCSFTLELMPRGEWASDVSFPIEYQVAATLELEWRDRLALDSDLSLSLELVP